MEILGDLRVTIEEETLIDMHSVLNVLNVLLYELSIVQELLGYPDALDLLHETVSDMADTLRNPDEAQRHVRNVDDFILHFRTVLDTEFDAGNPGNRDRARESLENIESIFAVLRVRAREIEARWANPRAWINHDIALLQRNFEQVFRAMARNSHGRYDFVSNPARQGPSDYLIHFALESADGSIICMPAVFQDVVRDLVANARKYTPPGGVVDAGLYDSGEDLRLVVRDTGMGMPPAEIPSLIGFGMRGSNAGGLPTRGGGFGLTKAYYVARLFGGRMWIDSPAPHRGGTRIEILLPRPVEDKAGGPS